MTFYFDKYEHRRPPESVPYSVSRELLWQFLATVGLVFGAWYIGWRWCCSLNTDALWFAIPLVVAETFAYIGTIFFVINLWKTDDPSPVPPPLHYADCVRDPMPDDKRPLSIDVFFPTYNEDIELVRLSVRDAKAVRYPHPIDIHIHILDDGRRTEAEQLAREEGVSYITRDNNIGFKAGNLRNAMERTSGDLIVICDADTRPFPTLLEHTLGYFRDPDVAWVQTPQWFFDLPEGMPLPDLLQRALGRPGRMLGRAVERVLGPINVGSDVFNNDPQMFYDVIQRRRNWANAAFCCGAGSIHRREAVMEAAMKTFADAIDGQVRAATKGINDEDILADLSEAMRRELLLETEVTPYKFHVSEDIYTSIVLHSDQERHWKSVYHPQVESKMLSPQDLLSWSIQRFKYAGGSLDIFFHDNPLFRPGLSLAQRLMYGATFWSYFAGVWNIVFLLAPIVYFFTEIPPVKAYSGEFFIHAFPFLIINTLAMMVGTWGISAWRGSAGYLAFFPLNLRALWTVVRGEKIKFPVTPKDKQKGTFLHLVIPQIAVIALTIAGMIFAGAKLALGASDNYAGFIANLFWACNNVMAMSGIVLAALWQSEE